MSRFRYLIGSAGVVLLPLAGCSPTPNSASNSKIIQQMQAAGSGPLGHASSNTVFNWFQSNQASRRNLAASVNQQCTDLKKATLPASWPESPEGQVCAAAREFVTVHAYYRQ
jgi:hypothetical protein